jgi:uncharacterized protein (TIGR00106 family)
MAAKPTRFIRIQQIKPAGRNWVWFCRLWLTISWRKNMALMQITVIPMGTETVGVSEYVADIQQLLIDRGKAFELNDMGTLIHGEPAELFSLAAEIHNCPFENGAKRVVTQIGIDERRDKNPVIGEKKKTVLDILTRRRNEEKKI